MRARMIATCLFAAAFAAANFPAQATDQMPDKITIDGAAPQNLFPYDFMKTPLWETFSDPQMWGRIKNLMGNGVCTALYRGYIATWEIKDATLYLVQVRMGDCGKGDVVPLTSLFPGSVGPIPATWFSGDLVSIAANDLADANDPFSKLSEKYQFIRVDEGRVTSYRIAWPNSKHRPCEFIWCVGDRLFFPSGSAELTPEAGRQLLRWALWMKRFPEDVMAIEGHADKSEKDAQRLSERRAQKAKQYLIEQGIEDHRVKGIAYGSARPLALEGTEAALAQNRRAVAIPSIR